MKIDGIHEKELFDSNFPFRIIFNRNVDFSYPAHWHSAVEILYIEQNPFTVYVNSKEYKLNEKDIMFIPSGDIHEFHSETPTGKRIFLNFETSSIGSYSFMGTFENSLSEVKVISPSETKLYNAVKTEIKRVVREYNSQGVTCQLFYIARLIDILVLISDSMPVQKNTDSITCGKKKTMGLEKINKTFEYIEKNYKTDIHLCDIAKAVGFSEYYFSRIFKDITEKSFHQYLNEYRIKKVETLLQNSDISIAQACYEVGFSSVITFNRVFKQIKGCTPQEYRKLRLFVMDR